MRLVRRALCLWRAPREQVGETICLYSVDRSAYLSMNDLEGTRREERVLRE